MNAERKEVPKLLADESPPATSADLFRRLEALGISFQTFHHPPVFTVEEAKALRGEIPGAHIKNLFLRTKKGAMWLVVCPEERGIDLKGMAKLLGGRLSFASPQRLMQYLGVIPGAVSPFGIINDHGGEVRVAFDRALDGATLNCHPLDNAMTSSIAFGDLVRFLEAEGHTPCWIDFESEDPPAPIRQH